jgi:replicative DNA helicase
LISEKAVLSGIFNYGKECYNEVCFWLEEETFSTELHKVIFKCLVESLNYPSVDFSSFLAAANKLNLDDYIEKRSQKIRDIFDDKPDINNVAEHAKTIRKLQFARELKNKLRKAATQLDEVNGSETLDTILSYVEEPIHRHSLSYIRESDNTPTLLAEGVQEYLDSLDEVREVGVATGFPGYDYGIGGGLRRRTVSLVGARLKTGKSYFGDNVGLNVSARGIPVLMLDTEMSKEDHWNRCLANLSAVEIDDIETGKFREDPEKVKRIEEAAKTLASIPYSYISINGKKFSDTLSIMRRWIMNEVGFDGDRTNPCVIIYDYFKLMSSNEISDSMQEYQALGFQIGEMHNFCVEMDVPCLAFVQLNRDGITKDDTSVISGSDRLGWLATNVALFKEKSEEEIVTDGVNNGNRKLQVIAARHGPSMQNLGYLCLDFKGNLGTIREIGFIRNINTNTTEQGNPEPF